MSRLGNGEQMDASWLNSSSMYFETDSGSKYPFTIFFDTGNITTTVKTKSGKMMTRNGGFGNFYGGFDAKKYNMDEEMKNVDWDGGVDLIEQDYIPQSKFVQALDSYDDEMNEKEQEELRKKQEADSYSSALDNATLDSSNYQNMFAEFMKANLAAAHQEENIDTSNSKNKEEEEEEEPETTEQLYNKFDFKNSHRYFTDYMQCLIHNKSKVEIPQYPGSFALFSEGRTLLSDHYLLDDMIDDFRYFLEKTDNMQCLRLWVDTDTGFGSFAHKYLTEISDELRKKPIMLYSVSGFNGNVELYDDERQSIVNELREYNSLISIASFNELVNSYIPINLDFNSQSKVISKLMPEFDWESLYHLSSVPALAINDLFMPIVKKNAQ